MAVVEVKDLTFRYKNRFIFDKFNLSVERGCWVTIAGSNGSGKTTLVKLLAGLLKSYSAIKILDKPLNKKNIYKIRRDVGFVFDNPDNYFACETVSDELAFSLENMGVAPKTIEKKIKDISSLLKIDKLLNSNPFELSGGEKQKVALGCALMLEPRVLILDEALLMIDINEREEMFKVLEMYSKKKNVAILSFTYDLEETLYSDRLVVLNDGKIIVDGTFPYVYEEEAVMRKIGLEVPFMIELSKKLNLFGLLNDIELDYERLVDKIWK